MDSTSAVEVQITGGGWGGDFALDDSGDLVLSVDTASTPQATLEWATRLVMTTPNLLDAQGNSIGYADDVFHSDWGAGIPAYVGGVFNDQTLQKIATSIRSQMSAAPQISQNPQPIVTLEMSGPASAVLNVEFYTTDGQHVVLPPLPLSPSTFSVSP